MIGRLAGKVAVITGGADGIGRAATERFIAEGAVVVVVDLQMEKGQKLVADLGERAEFLRGDIRHEVDFAAAVTLAELRFGGLDVMYHNAGAPGSRLRLEEMEVDQWDASLALQVRSGMLAIKHAIPDSQCSTGSTRRGCHRP